MKRLTSNKKVSDMSMIELAHNSCYADNERNARYRDYDLDIDSRQLVRNLMKDVCGEDLSDLTNEEFDEYMGSMLSIELDSKIGLLALFYRNLWAMANLRETLKKYEDLEEQDRLVKLPCKVGDVVYVKMASYCKTHYVEAEVRDFVHFISCGFCAVVTSKYFDKENIPFSEFGKTIFLTKEEVEAKLKELRGGEDGSME